MNQSPDNTLHSNKLPQLYPDNSEFPNLAVYGLIQAMNNINLVRNIDVTNSSVARFIKNNEKSQQHFLAEIHEASDQIYYLMCDLLANFGYNIMSQTTYNELLEISLQEAESEATLRDKLLSFVLRLSSHNIYQEGIEQYQLLCDDPQTIYQVLAQNRDYKLTNPKNENELEFLYHKEKILNIFIHKNIIALKNSSNAKILT